MASMRLRLTAHSLAGQRGPAPPDDQPDGPYARLRERAAELADFYDTVGSQVGHASPTTHFAETTRPAHRETGSPRTEDAVAEENTAVAELMVAADELAGSDTAGTADGEWTGRVRSLWFFLWVHEHLHHLQSHANLLDRPAMRVAELRQQPWWR